MRRWKGDTYELGKQYSRVSTKAPALWVSAFFTHVGDSLLEGGESISVALELQERMYPRFVSPQIRWVKAYRLFIGDQGFLIALEI